jgi:hypothetical protein
MSAPPFAIDGHFWIEASDGSIIEPSPMPDKKPFNLKDKYYKKASDNLQKLVIEIAYRKYEELYGFSRNSEAWCEFLDNHCYRFSGCFHNALKYLKDHPDGNKLVFGYFGVYHKVGGHYPKNTVYWIYGCSEYKSITNIFYKVENAKNARIDTYYTYEDWNSRDNKVIKYCEHKQDEDFFNRFFE